MLERETVENDIYLLTNYLSRSIEVQTSTFRARKGKSLRCKEHAERLQFIKFKVQFSNIKDKRWTPISLTT